MFKQLDLLPSYGRDYTSEIYLLKDWNANKDFIIASSGQYVNKQQKQELIANGFTSLNFRFNKKSKKYIMVL
jgi:hypothetical protein